MKKHITALVILAAATLAPQLAWGLGFGRVIPDAVLGQPLVFTAPVHVGPNEHFGADCVSADVYFGDSKVNPSDVRLRVERGTSDNDWLVRISTTAPIGEPIVEIAVSAGCDSRLVRRFTAFADPPNVAWSRDAEAQAQAPQPAAPAPAAAVPLAPRASGRTAPPATAGATPPHLRPVVRKGPTMALANEINAPVAPKRTAPVAAATPRKAGGRSAPVATDAAPRLVLDGGYARLKLDMEDPVIPPAGSAPAASAAISLSDLDDPAAQQMQKLEQSIQQLRHDSQASRDQSAKLRSELADAQSRSDLLPWVLGLLALALAAAVWLALRLRQQSRLAHSAWFAESQLGTLQPPAAAPAPTFDEPQVPTAPVPPHLDAVPDPREFAPDSRGFHVEEPDQDAIVADMSATRPLDRLALSSALNQTANEGASPRELSVEELLDLEQQADFFIALGQEDAAVDLLMSHLRSAGGQSPLPYTKLLEIYRRQGDRSAYERTRARFNRRFNAYAPDWDTGPTAGRTLEDYPETIAHIQAMWNSPIDSMASLEAMLFKRDDTSELFDLPAYRDVLLLYSLARDLWQLGGGLSGTPVDVLLPLGDHDGDDAFVTPLPTIGGLDLPLEIEDGGPTTFEMTGYEPPSRHEVDLQVPMVGEVELDGVHVTLDALSLEPVEPTQGPAAPDWELGTGDDEADKPPHKR